MAEGNFSFNKNAAYAVTSIDGRYASKTELLSPYFSEAALLKYRTIVEGEFLIYLIQSGAVSARKMTEAEIAAVRALYDFPESSIAWIKEKEATTNHDVKAVEYFIKEKLSQTTLKDLVEWVHFGLTSEDTNNLSYALMLSDSVEKVMIPEFTEVSAVWFEPACDPLTYNPTFARVVATGDIPVKLAFNFKVLTFTSSP
jgi:adenylosuccinate lyase